VVLRLAAPSELNALISGDDLAREGSQFAWGLHVDHRNAPERHAKESALRQVIDGRG
jgi:hypothetical protein